MSVTYGVAVCDDDLEGFEIRCYDDESSHAPGDYPDYESASKAFEAYKAEGLVDVHCCSLSPRYAVDDSDVAVNVSNSNAAALNEALGFVGEDGAVDLWGSAEVADLRGRILVARALASDVGTPTFTDTGEQGAVLIDCGRPAGYLARTFARLERLCDFAEQHGRTTIVWS